MSRRRRCAFDSDNLEEYIQLSTIGQNQTNLFYDDKKLKWLNKLKQSDDEEYSIKQIEGFEHGHCQNDYIDTSELPPDIHLKSSEEVITHHIMILGDTIIIYDFMETKLECSLFNKLVFDQSNF